MQFWKKLGLGTKIIIGIVIGIIIGLVSPAAAKFISPLGDIFLRMLKMLIVPLVFFSITSGICKMGDVRRSSMFTLCTRNGALPRPHRRCFFPSPRSVPW